MCFFRGKPGKSGYEGDLRRSVSSRVLTVKRTVGRPHSPGGSVSSRDALTIASCAANKETVDSEEALVVSIQNLRPVVTLDTVLTKSIIRAATGCRTATEGLEGWFFQKVMNPKSLVGQQFEEVGLRGGVVAWGWNEVLRVLLSGNRM